VPALSATDGVVRLIIAGDRFAGTSPSPAGGDVTAITASTANPTDPAPTRALAVRRRLEWRSISSTAAHASTS
jgi:hypothetical protein